MTNCIVAGNSATVGYGASGSGGGIANEGSLNLTNCTVTGNTANRDGGVVSSYGTLTLINDIVYGDTGLTNGEVDVTSSGTVAASFCDVQDGLSGTGNIYVDPLFVNAMTGDLHLRPGSCCIGAGTPNGAPATDLDGRARTDPPSIGAYDDPRVRTTAALTSSLDPSSYGQSILLTATVTGNGGTPTGTVTFYDGNTAFGAGTLDDNGVATFTTAALTLGSHPLTATYSSDANFAPNTSATLIQTVSTVNQVITTTALTSSLNPSVAGHPVTFTALVTGNGGTPTGTVTFTLDGVAQSPVILTNGQALLTTSTLTVGSHTLTATYGGDANFVVSTSATLTQTVHLFNTTTALTSSANPSVFGESVTFTATVTGSNPTGAITFTIDGAAQPPVTVSGGNASFTTSMLTVGSHALMAAYSGDANNTAGTSPGLSQTVNAHISPVYVSPSGSDNNPGSQALPKQTIQAGINASLSGDTVTVEDGTYTGPGNVDLDFVGRNITVASQNGPATTIIDCGGSSANHRGFYFHSGESSAVVSGLTIKNGTENNFNADSSYAGYGGGVDIAAGSAVTLTNCTLSDNAANYGGGGVYNGGTLAANNCTFTGNSTQFGGGVYNNGTLTLTNSIVVDNTGNSAGGGICNYDLASLTDCEIIGNNSINGGGAYSEFGTLTMINCTLNVNNGDAGGAVDNSYGTVSLTNCILSSNWAQLGGGVDNEYNSAMILTNCTVTGNIVSDGFGGILNNGTITLLNDIVYGDNESYGGEVSGAGAVTASYCDVQGDLSGTGNINVNPLFVTALI